MSRRQTDPARVVATIATAVAVTGLWVGLGGTVAPTRWLAAVAVAVAGIAAIFAVRAASDEPALPARWGWTAVWLAPAALALLPLPSAAIALLSPLRAEVAASGPLARDPEAARQALAVGLLAWAAGAIVVALPGWRNRDVERSAAAAIGLIVAVAVAHAASGLTALFGVIHPSQHVPTLFAPFVDTNHMAASVLLLVPLAVGALDPSSGRGPDPRGWLGAAGVIGLVFVYADARAGLLALAVAVASRANILATLRAKKTGYRSTFVAWWWAIPAVVAVIVAAAALGGEGRASIWAATVAMAAAHPWVGTGPGGFARALPTFVSSPSVLHWSYAHSDPLQYVAETGLVGMLAAGLAVAAWAASVNHQDPRPRRAVAGLALLGAVACVEFPLHLPLIVVLASMTAAWALRADGRPAGGRGLAGAGVLAAAGALALELVPSAEAQAQRDVDAASIALRAGDRAPAIAVARRLAAKYPDVPRWTHRAARLLTAAGEPAAAVEVATTSLRWAPYEERTWVDRAQANCARGETQAGADDYAAAVKLGGHHVQLDEAVACLPVGVWWVSALDGAAPGHLEYLAAVLLDQGDPAGALMAIDAAALADPAAFGASLLETRAWERLGDPKRAAAEAARVVATHPHDPEKMRIVAEFRARIGDDRGATEAWALAAQDPRWIPNWVVAVQRSQGATEALRVASAERLLGHGSPELDAVIADLQRPR